MANAAGRAIRPSQKSHDASSASTIRPAITSPTPPPMPNVALIPPIAVDTRSGGNVSRMIPNASGKMPPPTPWMTRPSTSTPSDGASAHTALPAANASSTMVRTRPRPKRSPSLPTIGVATAAASR